MKKIDITIYEKKSGELYFLEDENSFVFNYTDDKYPISLIMPYKVSSYIWKNKLHPIFDMNMPEGYLFELLKNYLSKEYGYINDFLIFSHLCSNIKSRLQYQSWCDKNEYISFNIDDILNNDTEDTFTKLVHTYLSKNAISGIQPKSLALLRDKESLSTKEYIIKTWGKEYNQLALNEYFCLKAVEKIGVKIPNIQLSQNNNFLLVERFNIDKTTNQFLGFEEILTLMGKNKDEKYSGSYEAVAKVVYNVTTNKLESIKDFFKVIVMNYLLKNGDAHLKNFGILYDKDLKTIWFAPTYDVVNTVVYYSKDRPALTMFGKKIWFGQKELVKFGIEHCYLSKKEAHSIYEDSIKALEISIKELKEYILLNNSFKEIGTKMLNCWNISLDRKSYKEIDNAITRDRD